MRARGPSPTQALILAAGQGSRLRQGARPKCLAEIDGRQMIEYQLDALHQAGVDDVTVVVGFEAGKVCRALRGVARTVHNPHYAATNSLFSFLLAADEVDRELLVMNCDVLFHPEIISMLVREPGSALAYDSASGGDEEHMKVAVQDGHLLKMSKDLPAERVGGENLGLIRLSRPAASRAFTAARQLVGAGRLRDWVGSAVNVVAAEEELRCCDVRGLPWIEIDFPEDLESARQEVLPAIRERLAPTASHRGREFFSHCFDRPSHGVRPPPRPARPSDALTALTAG